MPFYVPGPELADEDIKECNAYVVSVLGKLQFRQEEKKINYEYNKAYMLW